MPANLMVGGSPQVRAFVGTTPVKRTYVGSIQVWPAMTTRITNLGSTVFTGTANTNFPTHTAGDLLVVVAVGGAAPTAPAGWTTVYTSPSGNPAATIGYRFATGAGTGTGAWSGNAVATAYAFRGANKTTPFGKIGTNLGSGLDTTAPALTLTDPSGDSLVMHSYYNNGTTGAWINKVPAGFIGKNQQARMANNQMIDTIGATTPSSVMSHSASATWRTLAFELLMEPAVVQVGLYDVTVEYLPNYEVRFTALTSYPADPDEAFFFRSTPLTNDGYTGRTFTKTYRASAVPIDCTLEDYWANPTGIRNTVSFQIMPKP